MEPRSASDPARCRRYRSSVNPAVSARRAPAAVIGLFITVIGIWLCVAPRHSKVGEFLGPMIHFRFLGVVFVVFGVFDARKRRQLGFGS